MKKDEKIKNVTLIVAIVIIILLIIYIFILKIDIKIDNDYKKLGIDIEYYEVEYYTVYEDDVFEKYKVYKINKNSINDLKEQLENSELWSRNKYYEYIMEEFYEIEEGKEIPIDKEDVYYYEKGHAIFDVKNAKLYYLQGNPYKQHKDYSEILGIRTDNYEAREIYSVRGGPQNDGTDYYTYQFTKEQGKEIINTLEKSQKWSKDRLEDDKLDNFEYNKEVLSIENGYYHYEKVYRTSDINKKYNFTDEEATGWEIGVYDVDKNILYYYWTSY